MTNKSLVYAGIDLGSNSFRLLIASVLNQQITPLHKRLDTVRLGRGLADTGKLSPEAMALAFQVLNDYRHVLKQYRPSAVRACGTAALRQAKNSTFFLEQASQILDATLAVLSGEEEASLALHGAANILPELLETPVLLVDAGGGSTELIYANGLNTPRQVSSLPLGAVSLTEKFLDDPAQPSDAYAAMIRHIETLLKPFFQTLLEKSNHAEQPLTILATGGTATALAALSLNLRSYDSALIQGHSLSKDKLKDLLALLQATPPAKRNKLPGLTRKRGEIIIAGAAILAAILRLSNAPALTISDAGLLEGILLNAAA